MRLKTLQQAVNAMKAEDPDTALNRSMLLRLIADGILPCEMHGNRHIVDYDRVKRCLCDRLMLRDSRFGPHLRTVETAMRELRKKQPELGLGEDRIRNLIARGKSHRSVLETAPIFRWRHSIHPTSNASERRLPIRPVGACAIPVTLSKATPMPSWMTFSNAGQKP